MTGSPGTDGRPPRVVSLGGGHGLHATLSAMRRLTDDVTAVVTVADDGGSSGRIRRELDILPLGDLRMALGALAGQDDDPARATAVWQRVFEHRYGGDGALAGHAVGNLVLAGLLDVLDDPVAALDEACRLLGVRGRVLPMSPHPVDIEADVTGLQRAPGVRPNGARPSDREAGRDVAHRIRGQVAVATTPGRVQQVRLDPRRPRACAEACAALRAADVITLGPGSWFSSVLPHLLVPELFAALTESDARRVLVLNLAPQPGETAGFSPEEHLAVLAAHAPRLRLDVVVADPAAVPEPDRLRRGAEAFGAETLLATVGAADGTPRHDPVALAAALAEAMGHGGRREAERSGTRPHPAPRNGTTPHEPDGAVAHDDTRPQHEEDQRWP